MSSATFDTLQYAKRLKEAGVPEKQAEVQAETLAEILDDNLVTKQYLDLRLKELEASIKFDIIKWVAGMLVAQAALIVALIKLIK